LVTNLIMNRIHDYEGGGMMTMGEWLIGVGKALKSGWYAFIVPGIIFYGIFSGRLTPTEAGATAVVVTILMGFIMRTLSFADFPAMLVSSAKVNGVILPLADDIGMNEIQFCIMMITALGVGFITPPLGLNLFVVAGITGESILKIAARAVPFVLCMFIVVLFIAYVPAISTTLLPDIYK
jgi:C4-dicarboxylate transporter DctM subunit